MKTDVYDHCVCMYVWSKKRGKLAKKWGEEMGL